MVLSQCSTRHHISPRARLSRINIDHTNDTSCPCLNHNTTCLIKLVGKDVLVIGESDDELHYQLSKSSHDSSFGTVIRVFPADPTILFMQTDYISAQTRLPIRF